MPRREVTLVHCIGCDELLGEKPLSDGARKHAMTCPKHPLAVEIENLRKLVGQSLCPFCKAGIYGDSHTAGVFKCSQCGSVALPGPRPA